MDPATVVPVELMQSILMLAGSAADDTQVPMPLWGLPRSTSTIFRPLSSLSRSWEAITRPLLYSTLVVSDKTSTLALVQTLNRRPELAPLARRLEIHGETGREWRLWRIKAGARLLDECSGLRELVLWDEVMSKSECPPELYPSIGEFRNE